MNTDHKLFIVVGKRNGQLCEITALPMTLENCYSWIKEQGIENHYKFVFPIPYHGKEKEFIPQK